MITNTYTAKRPIGKVKVCERLNFPPNINIRFHEM